MSVGVPGAATLVFLGGCAARAPHNLEQQLEREVIALHQTVRRMEGELATCAEEGPRDRLHADLHQVFRDTEVVVHQSGIVTTVRIPAGHLFRDPSGAAFRDEGTMTLDLLATALKLHPSHQVVVEGHTNDRSLPNGPVAFRDHLDLSLHLARAVATRLAQDFGLERVRLAVAGRADWRPMATNDLPGGQDLNQRIEVHIQPTSER